jgi:hypothetical protein
MKNSSILLRRFNKPLLCLAQGGVNTVFTYKEVNITVHTVCSKSDTAFACILHTRGPKLTPYFWRQCPFKNRFFFSTFFSEQFLTKRYFRPEWRAPENCIFQLLVFFSSHFLVLIAYVLQYYRVDMNLYSYTSYDFTIYL